jgi:hypothetical protein
MKKQLFLLPVFFLFLFAGTSFAQGKKVEEKAPELSAAAPATKAACATEGKKCDSKKDCCANKKANDGKTAAADTKKDCCAGKDATAKAACKADAAKAEAPTPVTEAAVPAEQPKKACGSAEEAKKPCCSSKK